MFIIRNFSGFNNLPIPIQLIAIHVMYNRGTRKEILKSVIDKLTAWFILLLAMTTLTALNIVRTTAVIIVRVTLLYIAYLGLYG